MEESGQFIPSKKLLNINFRTKNNNDKILNTLKGLQKTQNVGTIHHQIFHENNAPFILIKTNLCHRPLKFLIDTGASLSLISNEIIPKNIYKKDWKINLYGLMGKEMPIRTKGTINTILNLDGQNINTLFHVVDGKFSGPGDGYLGYDFLSLYKARIDLQSMHLGINLEEKNNKSKKSIDNTMKMPEINKSLNDDRNVLNIIAQSYEYEPWTKTGILETFQNLIFVQIMLIFRNICSDTNYRNIAFT